MSVNNGGKIMEGNEALIKAGADLAAAAVKNTSSK